MPKPNRFSVITTAVVILFGALVYLFAWSPVFTVKKIEVTGAPTSESVLSITNASKITVGEKMARIEPRSVEQRLKSFSWVKQVDISRNWIDGHVHVKVVPRTPKAIFNGKTLDLSGTVFELPGFTAKDLPLVIASNPSDGVQAISLFTSLPRSFSREIASLTAQSDSNFTIKVRHANRVLTVKWGSRDDGDLKIQVFNALLKDKENKKVRTIDLSAPHAPIVK
ncbi:MAG: FtsQ-type POTRA domain-containing protein [Actinobacteria bacterium]|nr:FtsQ-type POTRA domain-containing protein [Actinomycetota bacterium]